MNKSNRKHLQRDVPRPQDEQDLARNARIEDWSSGWKDLVTSGFLPPPAKRKQMTEEQAFNICLQVSFEVRTIIEQHAALRKGGYRTH